VLYCPVDQHHTMISTGFSYGTLEITLEFG
jgi:hypothetical protein